MKKLTIERRAIVIQAIETGSAAFEAFKNAGGSTFTVLGRKLIQPYWDAQELIMETIGCSVTRACDLISGDKTLDDLFDVDGKPVKQVRS